MNALQTVLNGFLWGVGFGLAFLLMHALHVAPRICG